MLQTKFLPNLAACLLVMGSAAWCAQSLPQIIDFGRLVATPEKFDGKYVRVRGFIVVEPHLHDVGVILLYSSKKEAMEDPERRSISVSLKDARTGGDDVIKSGWVEVTARFVSIPVVGGKHIPTLTQIRRLDRIGEDLRNH